MTAINILLEEHKLFLQAVEITRGIQKIEDNDVYYSKIRDIILFFRNFSEIYHHPKEENILYPLLRNRSVNMSPEFIRETCDTHEDFKSMMAEIESNYLAYDYNQLRLAIDLYIEGIQEHIKKENKIILSVADKLLDEKELDIALKKFQEHDENHAGKEELIKDFFKINLQFA
jgi:hemerythrin-like domain-containing protein